MFIYLKPLSGDICLCLWTQPSLCSVLSVVLKFCLICFYDLPFFLYAWEVSECDMSSPTVPKIWAVSVPAICLWGGSTDALFSRLDIPLPHDAPIIHPKQFHSFALQDIYELKDQIQDVEGRYMQGLKELKVEGLELKACILLFSGSSMASLTLYLPTLTPLCPLLLPLTTKLCLLWCQSGLCNLLLLHGHLLLPVFILLSGCTLTWKPSHITEVHGRARRVTHTTCWQKTCETPFLLGWHCLMFEGSSSLTFLLEFVVC